MTPEEALRRSGVGYTRYGDELVARCPAHKARTGKDDRKPSWSVNSDTGIHHCFSCGWGGGFPVLLEFLDILDTPPRPKDADTPLSMQWDTVRERLRAPAERVIPDQPDEPEPMSWESFEAMTEEPPRKARVKRGISKEVCERYRLRGKPGEPVWAYPIASADYSCCLGWQEKSTGYSRNYPKGVKTHRSVFGVDQVREQAEAEVVLVVESPLDAARMATFGFSASCALFGSNPSQAQTDMIWDAAGERPVVAFMDEDPAGIKGAEQFARNTHGKGLMDRLYVVRLHGYGGGDPAALTRHQVQEVITWALQERFILTRLMRPE